MAVLGGWAVSYERGNPAYIRVGPCCIWPLSCDDVFQEKSTLYRAVEPEQCLQRHPEAGSSWPSWPQASHGLGFRYKYVDPFNLNPPLSSEYGTYKTVQAGFLPAREPAAESRRMLSS